MTKLKKYASVALVILAACLWLGCTQDRQPCLTPKIASLNMRMLHRALATDTTAIDTALPSAIFVALTAGGDKGARYNTQSTFTISLSSVADSCQWAFTTDTTVGRPFDTLTFYYQRQLQFISNACGYAYFYNLVNARTTHNFVDSLRITNTNITNNVNTTHLQVYIHPDY